MKVSAFKCVTLNHKISHLVQEKPNEKPEELGKEGEERGLGGWQARKEGAGLTLGEGLASPRHLSVFPVL